LNVHCPCSTTASSEANFTVCVRAGVAHVWETNCTTRRCRAARAPVW
jgi:hypothetical protein